MRAPREDLRGHLAQREVAPDEVSHVTRRPNSDSLGYCALGCWRDPEWTRDLSLGGWTTIGDLARHDAEGYLFEGRAKFGPRSGTRQGRPTLRRGMHDDLVKEIKRKVKLSPDGVFGPDTEDAVREFQRAHNLLSRWHRWTNDVERIRRRTVAVRPAGDTRSNSDV